MYMVIYGFYYSNGGWWLKIETVEMFLEYQKKILKEKAIKDFWKNYWAGKIGLIKLWLIMNFNIPLELEATINALECLKKHGVVYINRVGGYRQSMDYMDACLKDELIFP